MRTTPSTVIGCRSSTLMTRAVKARPPDLTGREPGEDAVADAGRGTRPLAVGEDRCRSAAGSPSSRHSAGSARSSPSESRADDRRARRQRGRSPGRSSRPRCFCTRPSSSRSRSMLLEPMRSLAVKCRRPGRCRACPPCRDARRQRRGSPRGRAADVIGSTCGFFARQSVLLGGTCSSASTCRGFALLRSAGPWPRPLPAPCRAQGESSQRVSSVTPSGSMPFGSVALTLP